MSDQNANAQARRREYLKPTRHEWLFLLVGSFLVLYYAWLMDDAYIYFRYADNFLFLGRGLVYNPGEYVEGYSSPLYMLLLLGLRGAGLDYWTIVRLLGLLCFFASWWSAIRVHRLLVPADKPICNVPLAFLATLYPFLSCFTSGLETPLVQLAACCVALAILEPGRRRWEIVVAALPLLRHEFVLVVPIVAAARYALARSSAWRLILLTSIFLGGWLLFRVWYYAALLPNTFYLKDDTAWRVGWSYLAQVVWSYQLLPFFLVQLAVAWWIHRRRDARLQFHARAWLALAAIPVMLYVVRVGGDSIHYRLLAYPIPLLILATSGLVEHALPSRRVVAATVAILVALGCSFLKPPQLERPRWLGSSHDGLLEPVVVDRFVDADAHRARTDITPSPWAMQGASLPIDELRAWRRPVTELRVHGWCAYNYRDIDKYIVHRWGLTDALLARVHVPQDLAGHRFGLMAYAQDLGRIRQTQDGFDGRPLDQILDAHEEPPRWLVENAELVRAVERRVRNRHDLLDNLRLAFQPIGSIEPQWASADRPNVLLIISDDLRWDVLRTNPRPPISTPGFDRLRSEGTLFADAFVTTSLCCPSRASIFSGLTPAEHGVTDIFRAISDSVRLFPAELRRIGYETAYVGKWHLNHTGNPQRDFIRWVSFRDGVSYLDPTLIVEQAEIKYEGHLSDVLTRLALRFLDKPKVNPFFLTLSHLAPHAPFVPQERFAGVVNADSVRLAANVGAASEGKPSWLNCRQEPSDFATVAARYYEMVAGVDASVEAVLAKLQELGILDETLVILIGDNGYHLGEFGLGDKRTAYEASMRIPLVLRYPKLFQPGLVVRSSLASHVDVAPTILGAVGLPSNDRLPGIDLAQMATGARTRDSVLYQYEESPSEDEAARCTPQLLAIRTLDEKLILSWPGSEREFAEYYRLDLDPLELHNVVGDSTHAARIAALRSQLGTHAP